MTSEEADWSSQIDVDVYPAKEISAKNVTVHGLTDLSHYRVTYQRFDGCAQVPAPIVKEVDPTMLTSDNDALILRYMALLTQEALSTSSLVELIPTNETLLLGAILELVGEDADGKAITAEFSLILRCSDM